MGIKDIAEQHKNDSVKHEDYEAPLADFFGYDIPQDQYDALISIHEKSGISSVKDAYDIGFIEIEDDVGVVGYHFYNNFTKELPSEIENLDTLKRFRVTASSLKSLPDYLSDFENLESLNIGHTSIKSGKADVIGELGNLKSLALYNINYDVVSNGISNLTKLRDLEMSSAKATNIDQVYGLKNLERLVINFDPNVIIDEGISNLEKIEDLDLNYNHISSLPESICQLEKLKKMVLSSNELKSVPKSIGDLTSLEHLNLRINKIKSLPESITNLSNLEYLYVEENRIQKMPHDIYKMVGLKDFRYQGNQLSNKEIHRIRRIFRR